MRATLAIAAGAATLAFTAQAAAQTSPTVVDPKLEVREVEAGLTLPIGIAFLDDDDFFVIEKASGKVKRIRGDAAPVEVLDLAVNSASERGLLGITLDKYFRHNGFVYLYWTRSLSGADSTALPDVDTLSNQLDRYKWNGTTLTFDKTLLRMRARQMDAGQPERGNHNGGPIRTGPDGKIYLIAGDTGRRGQMQNLIDGPFVYPPPGDDELIEDDTFGGPDPDARHLTGVILRINTDGSAPRDNPFYKLGAERGGSVGAGLKKLYAYGIRNSFGMTFDPFSGDLWEQENGDDSFSEINRVEPGFNSGWVQVMGPLERVAEFKAIETNTTAPQPFAPNGYFGLQQIRWLPTNIASSPREAYDRLFKLPGSRFSDPEMAWRYEVAPGGIDFLSTRELGHDYKGDLFVGSATANLRGGHIFRLDIENNRKEVDVDDRRLRDRVADNNNKYDITESETLLFGENFGVTPDLQESPDDTLYVVSLSKGAIYEIRKK
jgi:glucose/arabinose dehydrogenase